MVCDGGAPGSGLSRARKRNDKGDDPGSSVLVSDTSDGGASCRPWEVRRQHLPLVSGWLASTKKRRLPW
ncbi:hypothetical protein DEO72_LG2g3839 [Vigna unguiculata]|uniref:Uncharacterized protein n=1 Tax=Vigna unguiculata TaxID=3917 RepID=A0A4D6L4V9_VIGUN|nr:hypothetical protein DEO72_LG2g3839 [Vigna unguiculata]